MADLIPFYVRIDVPGHDKLLECLISHEPANGITNYTSERTIESIFEEVAEKEYDNEDSRQIASVVRDYLRKARDNGNDKQRLLQARIGPHIKRDSIRISTVEREYYVLYVVINEKPVRLGGKDA